MVGLAIAVALMAATGGMGETAEEFQAKTNKAATSQRNKVDAVVLKQATRPTLTGVITIAKDSKGFLKATLKAEDGTAYAITNPAIVEDKDGQKVKVVVGSQKTDSKTKAKSIQVEDVQAAR
jgi:hypothetical protein